MKKIVSVTGATGFLGKRLCLRLLKDGFEVRGIGRNPTLGRELENSGVRFCRGDLSDQSFMGKAVADATFVVHCAGLSSPWGKYRSFYEANVLGTKNVIDACKANQVLRLVHVSTPSIYFDYRDRISIREDEPIPERLVNAYAQTKYDAEQLLAKAFEQGLDTIIIRPRGLIGAGDTSVLPRVMKALETGVLPLFRGGEALVDLTHIDNVVDALTLCLSADSKHSGKIYNISNSQPMMVKDLLALLSKSTGVTYKPKPFFYEAAYPISRFLEIIYGFGSKEPPVTAYTLGLLAYSNTLNIDAAKKDLGYAPRIPVEEGIFEFLSGWKSK